MEMSYLKKLSEIIEIPSGRKSYTYSQGLCLNHLGMLVSIVPSRETVRFLLEHAARRFVQVSEDMKSYALKFDALAANSLSIDEMDAYVRGVVHSVGEKELCSAWELDAEI
jgi:hypothetical protein